MELMNNIGFSPNIKTNKYMYNGVNVPRVSEILSSMDNMDFLPKWANYLGYKRQSYEKTVARSATIGTYVHEFNEMYLKGIGYTLDDVPIDIKQEVINGHSALLKWYNVISQHTINIVALEIELICQWYGGTCDLVIEINGKTYIVDYKTSNKITYKYFLQLAAYKHVMEMNGYKIDGCIILQLDKNSDVFTEYVLNFDVPEHAQFIHQCTLTFESMLYSYYNKLYTMEQYSNIF